MADRNVIEATKGAAVRPRRRGQRLTLGALALTPTPTPIDPTMQRWQERVDRLQQFFAALQRWIDHAVGVVVVSAATLGKLAIAATAAYVAIRLIATRVQPRLRRGPRTALRIVPPVDSTYHPEAWVACFRSLYGIAAPWWKCWLLGRPWLTFEFRAEAGRVRMLCHCPESEAHLVRLSLRAALPGAEVIEDGAVDLPTGAAARTRLGLWRDPLYGLGAPRVDTLEAAIGALASGGDGVVQVAITPHTGWERRAQRRLHELSGEAGDPIWLQALLWLLNLPIELIFDFVSSPGRAARPTAAATTAPAPRARPLPTTDKAFEACWRAEIRICCWAARASQARRAIAPVADAFQALDGDNRLRRTRVWWSRGIDVALRERGGPTAGNLVLSARELAQLCHLPLTGVPMDAAHVWLLPQRPLGREGSVLGRLEDGARTPVCIAQEDRRQHVWLLGPTGSGKSTVMMNLALQDIAAGVGVGLIDPKGDLVRDLLERLPEEHAERLVLFDPAQRDQPLGLNVFDCADEAERELVTDGVVSIFRKTYERFWGPRTDDILRAAVLTLLRHPGATLCDVPVLLTNRDVRARLTRRLDDPIGLKPFWQEYEAFSEGQRAQMVGPVLNKLRSFLLRPTVRNVLGQSRSTVDVAEVIDNGGLLLVNLSKGALGEESSRLLGAFIVARLWQTALRRAQHHERWRPDFNLFLDEFQNYLHLPQSLDDVLTEARAYRLNLTLANQNVDQLHATTRAAVEANARTKVLFQVSQGDGRHLAREFAPLSESQLEGLDLRQVAVRLCQGGRSDPAFTALTEPAPPSLGEDHADRMAKTSLDRHGRSRHLVEAELQRRLLDLGYRGDFKEIA